MLFKWLLAVMHLQVILLGNSKTVSAFKDRDKSHITGVFYTNMESFKFLNRDHSREVIIGTSISPLQ